MKVNLFNAVDIAITRGATKEKPVYFKEWRAKSGMHYYRIYKEDTSSGKQVRFEHYEGNDFWQPIRLNEVKIEECENPFVKKYKGRETLEALCRGETLTNKDYKYKYKLEGDELLFKGGDKEGWVKSCCCLFCSHLLSEAAIKVEEKF